MREIILVEVSPGVMDTPENAARDAAKQKADEKRRAEARDEMIDNIYVFGGAGTIAIGTLLFAYFRGMFG